MKHHRHRAWRLKGCGRGQYQVNATGGSLTITRGYRMQDGTAAATGRTYGGLFLVTLATLMYEVLLTRIFSVTMWYHYGFMAISVALFGMTVGALLVYLLPARFPREGAKRQLAWSALLFAGAIVASFVAHADIRLHSGQFAVGVLVPTYIVTSVPFTLSGMCVALALTRFPKQVSALYAVDLAGAAAGCLLLICVLDVTDGPTAVIVIAALAGIGAALFAADAASAVLRRVTLASTVLLVLFASTNGVLANHQSAILRLSLAGGHRDLPPLYEKWNSFSRVTVYPISLTPHGWGMSSVLPPDLKVPQLGMSIDVNAFTVITGFDGNVGRLEYLKYDITNIAHYLRRDARVLVVGAGGGRDILSALVFGQKSVVAVELNKNILGAVNRGFGRFSGHLDRDPRVTFINDEARSYVARSPTRYDIIQLSLIDTAAATAAGAYMLVENSLYTVEAWTLFLERLNPDGVLTVSRWFAGTRPGEMYKATALAAAALKRLGVANPREHLVIVKAALPHQQSGISFFAATILVSKAPFSETDLAALEAVARRMRFDVALSPRSSSDPMFTELASGLNPDRVAGALSLKLTPPTDDSPFFSNLLRARAVLNRDRRTQAVEVVSSSPVSSLGLLLLVLIALTLACIIGPLVLTGRHAASGGNRSLLVYFASIGVGFMMVEISQMQRLTIFLGHPTYGLSVVLFALLVSSGAGSLSTRTVQPGPARPTMIRLGLILVALCAFGALTPWALGAFREAPTPQRILVAVLLLFPVGLFMGMAFPLGMKVASERDDATTPWLWGINGATSVCASVLAVAVAMSAGISVSFWSGVACYGVAAAACALASRNTSASAKQSRVGAMPGWPAPLRSRAVAAETSEVGSGDRR